MMNESPIQCWAGKLIWHFKIRPVWHTLLRFSDIVFVFSFTKLLGQLFLYIGYWKCSGSALVKIINERLSPLLTMTTATSTRRIHGSHQEVPGGELLAYTSARFLHELKLPVSHLLFWNFLVTLDVPLTPDMVWDLHQVQQAGNSSHCSRGCEKKNCAAQHVSPVGL